MLSPNSVNAPAINTPTPPSAQDPAWPKPFTAWYSVALLALISMMSNIDRSIITLLVEPIKADFELSDTQMSMLIGLAFSVPYMLVGLPMSRQADKGSRKLIISVGLTIWSLATALTALAQNFIGLLLARSTVGAAESVQGPSSLSLISDLVPRNRMARAMSIYSMGIAGGMAGSMIIGGVLLTFLGKLPNFSLPLVGELRDWQMVFVICGLPGLLLAALFWITVPEPARRGRKNSSAVPVREVAAFLWANRAIYVYLFLGIAILSIEAFGLLAWRVVFYERTYGWPPETSGPILGLITLVTLPIGLMLGTFLGEKFDKLGLPDSMLRIYVIGQFVMVPMAVAGPLMPSPYLAIACGLISGVAGGVASPGQTASIQIVTPNEMRGQITAVYLFTISVIGSGLGPIVVALCTDYVFADETQLRYAMALVAGTLGPLGLFLAYKAKKAYGEAVGKIIAEEKATA